MKTKMDELDDSSLDNIPLSITRNNATTVFNNIAINGSNIIINNNVVSGNMSGKIDGASFTIKVTRGSKKAPAKAQPKNQIATKKSSKKDLMSDHRLGQFMERSKYEAYIDPYRGVVPFFHISFPLSSCADSSNLDTDDSSNDLVVGQHVFVESNHPAVIVSIDQEGKTAVVKWSNSKEGTVDLDNIILMDTGKTRSGRSSTSENLASETFRQNELAMELYDKHSPWKKCIEALNPDCWKQITIPQGADVINLDNADDENNKRAILVNCSCSSVNEWAESEWEAAEKKRMAALKKKRGKKNSKKKNNEVLIIGSDDEHEEDVNKPAFEEAKDEIICGRRGDGECACDYNPFCLASLGGIFDEYRYNVAKTKQLFEGSNTTPAEEQFFVALKENWAVIPSRSEKEAANPSSEENYIRGSILVEKANVQAHMLTHISTLKEGEIAVDTCMKMLLNHHNLLIMPSMQLHLSENDSNIQLSKPPGLKNLGATCYLNSQLQCLVQNLAFMHGILSWKPTMPAATDARSIASAKRMNDVLSSMQSIMARMRYGHESNICTNEFALALGLENDEMQDPNEFAGLLFDRIQDSFKQCAQAGLSDLLPSIYWGKSSITTKCSGCNNSSIRTDDFKFLAIPIVEPTKELSRPKGVSNDVDVQLLLEASLSPESMEGDNQCFCSGCNQKCDATRTPNFEKLPPVLNLQLNRYVFNMESFSKQKLTTKVLLPHTIEVPVREETKSYMLVAVQNHLGNSAHGGHYVANVMDWSTGVWFEFNDEDVDVLENGPVSAFYPDQIPSDEDVKPRKISGSADAYNLLYVEKGFLSATTQTDLAYCKKGDALIAAGGSSVTAAEETTYQLYSRMRLEQFKAETEEHAKKARQQSRLEYRRKELINELFCSGLNTRLLYSSNKSGSNVLVELEVLQRFFSCKDCLEDMLKDKSLLCQHGGVHPTTAAKLKLLPIDLYNIISRILDREHGMLIEDDLSTITNHCIKTDRLALKEDDIVCQTCSANHQLELRRKFARMENLLDLYAELQSSKDICLADDSIDACALSKCFVTSFNKYIEGIGKALFNETNSTSAKMPPGGDLFSLDFNGLNRGMPNEKAASNGDTNSSDELDTTVNSKITCEHGHCNVMHNRRSTRIIPKSLWTKIVKVFPNAIMHKYQPPSDECIGDCNKCYLEKESAERFPIQIKEWKSSVENNELLLSIAREDYSITISDQSMFSLFHHDQVQGWRDAFFYLKRSKKNVSTNTVRARLLELCPFSQTSLICEQHKQSIIPNFAKDDKCLKTCRGVELIEKSHSSALLNSISSLQEILQNNQLDSVVAVRHKPPTVFVDEDQNLIEIVPELCSEGCVCLERSEDSDDKKAQVSTIDDDVEIVEAPKTKEDQVFNICVYEVEGGIDLDVAASAILADLDTSVVPSQQRRSRRKKKGAFPIHSLQVPKEGNLAQLRLVIHEKTGNRLLRQSLHLIDKNTSTLMDLTETDNSKDLSGFISDQVEGASHIIMTYKENDSGEQNEKRRTRKRPTKIDDEMEESLLSTLTELAFRGMKSDQYDVCKGKRMKRRREERGFRGTFLASSPSKEPGDVEADDDNETKSVHHVDIAAS